MNATDIKLSPPIAVTASDKPSPNSAIHAAPNGTDAAATTNGPLSQHDVNATHPPPSKLELVPTPPDNTRSLSTCAELSTPLDPATIPVHPPHGTPPPPQGDLLEDVKMAEQGDKATSAPVPTPASTNGINGIHHEQSDADMASTSQANGQASSPTGETMPMDASTSTVDSAGPSTSHTTPAEYSPRERPDADEDDEKPPPAKRARKLSDADQSSLANTASPPPVTASTVHSNGDTVMAGPTSLPTSSSAASGSLPLTAAQHKYCMSTVRQLKRIKDAAAFLYPVDPVALNIPHYPTVIKNPMDLSTVERKLSSSLPQKSDPNPANPRYHTADEFIADVRLIFSNCITFNGPDHVISQAGKHVESVFDKQIKQLPSAVPPKPPVVKKQATPPPPPPPVKKAAPPRRPSATVPVIRRNESEAVVSRPKREIHPPPPKDLPYADVPKKLRKPKRVKDDGTVEQLRFCSKILTDLHKKQHWAIAHPFYEPVDHVALDIPSYPKIIKKPMDLSTMRKKLDSGDYPNVMKFYEDFKLMIRNCFLFNPSGTPVNQAGVDLQKLFDEKWKNLPPLKEEGSDEDEYEEDEATDEDRARAIASIEAQIESMRGNLLALKNKAVPKEKKKKEKKEKLAPVASTSKSTTSKPKAAAASNGSTKRKKKSTSSQEDDTLSFEQKKDLSDTISRLDGTKLEKVIQIIHEGVPEIRDSTEEIELEIDLLPTHVLTKLYNFVIRPIRAPPAKRARTGKGTGTGGLKRKSMDESAEAEKIRKLEERMKLFEQQGSASAHSVPAVIHDDDSERSSDSSSGSDSDSASESE